MSSHPSGTGPPSGAGPSTPKAIGSLAKKQTDVTRQGTQKLKFVPVLPARRKKDPEVKPEAPVHKLPASPDRGRGRGRGRGDDGRGRGRGAGPRPPVEMTASGPFAMGPTMAGSSVRRSVPRSNFAPIVPTGPGPASASALGAGLSRTAAPSLKNEKGKEREEGNVSAASMDEDEMEAYSDPDEGVEIIDMENVRKMDWMAPESLQKDKSHKRKIKKLQVKKEDADQASVPNVKVKESPKAQLNALDLSESEEEEELIEDFSLQANLNQDPNVRQERLYFFQFPSPFPTFFPPDAISIDVDAHPTGVESDSSPKKVTFAAGSKAPAQPSETSAAPESGAKAKEGDPEAKVDGIIGQLEVYQSGAVKMRLVNGILLDVTAATQPSFLQHAVHLDMPNKRLSVLGEVNKRFVVSPNVETLLAAMVTADNAARTITLGVDGEEGLIKMET